MWPGCGLERRRAGIEPAAPTGAQLARNWRAGSLRGGLGVELVQFLLCLPHSPLALLLIGLLGFVTPMSFGSDLAFVLHVGRGDSIAKRLDIPLDLRVRGAKVDRGAAGPPRRMHGNRVRDSCRPTFEDLPPL